MMKTTTMITMLLRLRLLLLMMIMSLIMLMLLLLMIMTRTALIPAVFALFYSGYFHIFSFMFLRVLRFYVTGAI